VFQLLQKKELNRSRIKRITMPTIVVLFNLKPGASVTDYENWARSKDIPVVNSLPSVETFRVLKMGNLLGSDATGPYAYCELIEVPDMNTFFGDLSRDDVQAGAKQFGEFADQPLFIVATDL
jgi:hypothetical protein